MNTYNVQQVADALSVNPETVRRWIRARKLKASQGSKKEGNIIKAEDLGKFLETYPKYASSAVSLAGTAIGLGAPVASAVIAAGFISGAFALALNGKSGKEILDEQRLSESDLAEILREGAKSYRSSAKDKRDEAAQLSERIERLGREADEDERNAEILEGVIAQLEEDATEQIPEKTRG